MSVNLKKWTRTFLKRFAKTPPSLKLDLYDGYFKFENQDGSFQFESPAKCFLEFVREQRLPADLLGVFDEAGVKFYDGCLLVEVNDHRQSDNKTSRKNIKSFNTGLVFPVRSAIAPPVDFTKANFADYFEAYILQEKETAVKEVTPAAKSPDKYRIILGPSPETLWTDLSICSTLTSKWELSIEDALQAEAKILAYSQPTLCLDPVFEVTRIANSMLRATTAISAEAGTGGTVAGRKRKRKDERGDSVDLLPERRECTSQEREMRLYDETLDRAFVPTFTRLDVIEAARARKQEETQRQAAPPVANSAPSGPSAAEHTQSNYQAHQAQLIQQMQAATARHPQMQQPQTQQAPLTIPIPPKNRKASVRMDEGSPPASHPLVANQRQQSMNSVVIEAQSPPAQKAAKAKGTRKKKAAASKPSPAPNQPIAGTSNVPPAQNFAQMPAYNPLLQPTAPQMPNMAYSTPAGMPVQPNGMGMPQLPHLTRQIQQFVNTGENTWNAFQ